MFSIKPLILALLVIVATSILFQTCETKYDETSSVLNVVLENYVVSMDPAKAFNDESLKLIGQSYETLYQYHYLKRPYEVVPLLADGMPQVSNNGKTYTIKIKKGVVYHPHPAFQGKARFVTSRDFANQIKRIAFIPLKSLGGWLFENRLIGFDEFSKKVGDSLDKLLSTKLAGIETPDDQTLILKFSRNESIVLNLLTMNFITPLPEEVIKYEKNDFEKAMIGTGPYVLTKNEGEIYELSRFTGYRKDFYPSSGDRYANVKDLVSSSNEPIPFVDKIVFKVIPDEDARMTAFMKREIDYINIPKKFVSSFAVSFGELPEQFKNDDVVLKHFASISSDWISFNMHDTILGANKKLRKAIAYAIDYEKYITVVTKGANRRANSIYNPGITGYNPRKSLPYYYNLKKARELMIEAGFSGGKGLPTITYSTRSDTGIHLEVGEFIKEQLKQIGINVNVEILKFADFLKKGRAGQLQLFLDRWIYDYPDAENLVQLLVSKNHPGINKSGFSNKKLDIIYRKYLSERNEDKKIKLMEEVEQVVFDEVPWIMLTYYSSYILHYKDIKNYRKSSFIRNHFKYIKKEK